MHEISQRIYSYSLFLHSADFFGVNDCWVIFGMGDPATNTLAWLIDKIAQKPLDATQFCAVCWGYRGQVLHYYVYCTKTTKLIYKINVIMTME
jgi:hypothetical protein